MRDFGLEQAICAAGGVNALARKIGISQPSLSSWSRVPADRVLAVEGLTGVDRAVLRPDLYGVAAEGDDDVDAARVREYQLLSALLRQAPSADLLGRLSGVRGDASVLGLAHAALGAAASATTVELAEREFFELFVGVGRGELLPYGSYYLTGFLNERPLARLRNDLVRLGIERVETEVEPEDHVAVLCEVMAGLTAGIFATAPGTDRAVFEKHLAPWIGQFFSDLEQARSADFYRSIGRLGRIFIDIESEAFALAS